jgi:hypothetical protein
MESESDMCKLVNAAKQLQFYIVPTETDGNCMFLALAEQLAVPGCAQQLRNNIIAYLRNHPETVEHVDFEAEKQKSFDEYVEHMSHDGVWGDGIVLEAAVKLFQRPISVLQPDGREIWLTSPEILADSKPLRLGYVASSGSGPRNHYVSLRPITNIESLTTTSHM